MPQVTEVVHNKIMMEVLIRTKIPLTMRGARSPYIKFVYMQLNGRHIVASL